MGANEEEEYLEDEGAQGSASSSSSPGHRQGTVAAPQWDSTVTQTCFPLQSQFGNQPQFLSEMCGDCHGAVRTSVLLKEQKAKERRESGNTFSGENTD